MYSSSYCMVGIIKYLYIGSVNTVKLNECMQIGAQVCVRACVRACVCVWVHVRVRVRACVRACVSFLWVRDKTRII